MESLDFASLHNLKILFVCENNNYSVYSPIKNRQYKKRSITKIAQSVGIESSRIDSNPIIFYSKVKNILKNIKLKNRPFLIESETFRYLEHCGPANDDHLNYRTKNYVKKWTDNDHINFLKEIILKKKMMSNYEILKMEKKISKEINESFRFAENSKFPDKKYLTKFIYS